MFCHKVLMEILLFIYISRLGHLKWEDSVKFLWLTVQSDDLATIPHDTPFCPREPLS